MNDFQTLMRSRTYLYSIFAEHNGDIGVCGLPAPEAACAREHIHKQSRETNIVREEEKKSL